MKAVANLVIVVGFCAGTVGAAGFHGPLDPEVAAAHPGAATEPLAWPLFGGGLALVFVGGVLARTARRASLAQEGAQGGGARARLRGMVEAVRDRAIAIDEAHAGLSDEELARRIDALMTGELFDLTSQHEELAASLGFADYARVWDGVATGERLLARVWSLATDGGGAEAAPDLARARRSLERAAEVAATL